MATTPIEKILVVDDEADIRLIAEISLRDVGGFEVTLAESGPEGIRLAGSEQPDLILLDMMMPQLDGMATLDILRADAATKDIPVIFLTAKVQRHEIATYLAAGAQGVITKPFDPMELPDEVRRIAAELDGKSTATGGMP